MIICGEINPAQRHPTAGGEIVKYRLAVPSLTGTIIIGMAEKGSLIEIARRPQPVKLLRRRWHRRLRVGGTDLSDAPASIARAAAAGDVDFMAAQIKRAVPVNILRGAG